MTGTEFLKFVEKYRKNTSNNRKDELIERFELNTNGKIKNAKFHAMEICIFCRDTQKKFS